MELYSSLSLGADAACAGWVGAGEPGASALGEATVRYHSGGVCVLTLAGLPGGGPRLVGSLTGAVAS